MTDTFIIRAITRATPGSEEVLRECEPLHVQLRPDVQQPYTQHMQRLLIEGASLAVGHVGDELRCLAVYRVFQTTLGGARLYVDDLVTDEMARSQGYGATMLNWLERAAAADGTIMSTLDSGVARPAAHRFYIKQGYDITAFCFEKTLLPTE